MPDTCSPSFHSMNHAHQTRVLLKSSERPVARVSLSPPDYQSGPSCSSREYAVDVEACYDLMLAELVDSPAHATRPT